LLSGTTAAGFLRSMKKPTRMGIRMKMNDAHRNVLGDLIEVLARRVPQLREHRVIVTEADNDLDLVHGLLVRLGPVLQGLD